MGSQSRGLSDTAYGLLGLLTWGERSGYDLMKLARETIGHFWSPAKSQVYSELRRLAEQGYAVETVVTQDQRPDKRLYRITGEGRTALQRWLDSDDVRLQPVRSSFLLKVFFADHMPSETLVSQLEAYRRLCEQVLRGYRRIEAEIKDRDDLFYPYVTLRLGILDAEASLRWADETLAKIESKEKR